MTESRDELLMESFSFIDENPDLISSKLPNHLLKFWILDVDRKEPANESPQFSVYFYALIKFHRNKGENEFKITEEEIKDLFTSWQFALSVIEVDRFSPFNITPFKLFDFDVLNNLEVEILNH